MPGIILSLLVTLLALSFAFYTDDSSMRAARKNRRSPSLQVSTRTPGTGTEALAKNENPEPPDRSDSTKS